RGQGAAEGGESGGAEVGHVGGDRLVDAAALPALGDQVNPPAQAVLALQVAGEILLLFAVLTAAAVHAHAYSQPAAPSPCRHTANHRPARSATPECARGVSAPPGIAAYCRVPIVYLTATI